jgi:hypothetical protein
MYTCAGICIHVHVSFIYMYTYRIYIFAYMSKAGAGVEASIAGSKTRNYLWRRVCVYTYTYTYIHTYIHTYIQKADAGAELLNVLLMCCQCVANVLLMFC